jgi:hypothetical protein
MTDCCLAGGDRAKALGGWGIFQRAEARTYLRSNGNGLEATAKARAKEEADFRGNDRKKGNGKSVVGG